MDSVWNKVVLALDGFDFYVADINGTSVSTDGTSYLLEDVENGMYRLSVGRVHDSRREQQQLDKIAFILHHLIPEGIIPNLDSARKLDDVLFTVFTDDRLRN